MEWLISERVYNRNAKIAMKQDIAVLIKIFFEFIGFKIKLQNFVIN